MLTGIIIGAVTLFGIALVFAALFPWGHKGVDWRIVGLIVLGATCFGGAVGAAFSLGQTEPCPEGMVRVYAAENAAGASGCVPHETLKEITR